ncbi:hypothetical protein IT417_00265 [bacterium]|nr:hypothetical protein [bacterium]
MDKKYTTKQIASDTIEIKFTLENSAVTKSYETLLNNELKNTNLKGFRKGVTPRELVESKLQPQLLFEVLNRLAPLTLSSIVSKEKINLIAAPEYKEIPNLELGKNIDLTVHVTVMPEFKLGNMKKIKVTPKSEKVKVEEVEKIMTQLESNPNLKTKKGSKAWAKEAAKLLQIEKAETVEELKVEITKVLQAEKDNILRKQSENDALSQAIALSKIVIPDPAIHYEAHERQHSFGHQLEGMNMTMDQYAKTQGVTVEHMVEMWHKDAKEALETDVFLKLYAKEKGIKVSDEELKIEIEKVKKSNNQNPELYDNPEWQEYIRRVTLKQRAYEQFLKDVMPKSK